METWFFCFLGFDFLLFIRTLLVFTDFGAWSDPREETRAALEEADVESVEPFIRYGGRCRDRSLVLCKMGQEASDRKS